MEQLLDKLKFKLKEWQEHGVPVFFFRDEQKKAPSVSLTCFLISFVLVVFGLVNKWAKFVDGVDVDNSLELLVITASLYFGRSFSKKMQSSKTDSKDE